MSSIEAFVHEFPGWHFSLEQFLGDHSADERVGRLVKAFDALETIVQPWSIDLELGCWERTLHIVEAGRNPPMSAFFLRGNECPTGIEMCTHLTEPELVEADTVDGRLLQRVLENALVQECADSATYHPCLVEINTWTTSARLIDAPEGTESLALRSDAGLLEAPVHWFGDEAWVTGPLPSLRMTPPLRVQIIQDAGNVTLTIAAHWSPWTRKSSSEHRLLMETLEVLEQQDWKLTQTPIYSD